MNHLMESATRSILLHGEKGAKYNLHATVHVYAAGMTADYRLDKVLSLDIEHNYIDNYAERKVLTARCPAGDVAVGLSKAERLEVSMMVTYYRSVNGRMQHTDTKIERHSAILINVEDPNQLVGKAVEHTDTLSQVAMMEVQFELVAKTAEELGMIVCGGIFRETDTETVIKTVLTNEAVQGSNDYNLKVKGVDMVPAVGLEKRDHIVIPHGLKLIDLPQYLQAKCGGVYPTGCGYYLQDRIWYVWPMFDYSRLNETKRTITFISIKANKAPKTECSYTFNGDQLIALSTGSTSWQDTRERDQRGAGAGVSFTKASAVLGQTMVTQGENKAKIDRAASNTEVITQTRADEKYYVPVSPRVITDNNYNEFAKLARRQATGFMLTWESSDPEYIKPGMMVKTITEVNGNLKEVIGVVGRAHHYFSLTEIGVGSDTYHCNSVITVLAKPGSVPEPLLQTKPDTTTARQTSGKEKPKSTPTIPAVLTKQGKSKLPIGRRNSTKRYGTKRGK